MSRKSGHRSTKQTRERLRSGKTPVKRQVDGRSTPSERERLRLRDKFFQHARVDPREILRAFEHFPGLSYFVKDVQSRTMLSTREYTRRIGVESRQDNIGKRPDEYMAREFADHYRLDDLKVLRSGHPLRNIVEIGFNERGVPDWFITNKFPLRDVTGRLIGIIGTIQVLKSRLGALPHMGAVGRATHYIGQHLDKPLRIDEVADYVGLSKRHLQRLFHKSVRMTIQQFVIRSRIHAAAHELINSERPLAEIALMFGFSDQSAFSNTFRRIVAVTPSEYRRRFLQEFTD
ncbi:MAG TPA: helix-turn-helix domain-containing protein [Humisphaera sp.]|jgi:AraC-like DNA-binding protein|nr:helix-turn-helix domain-containing protein [Humisphaera sp.]